MEHTFPGEGNGQEDARYCIGEGHLCLQVKASGRKASWGRLGEARVFGGLHRAERAKVAAGFRERLAGHGVVNGLEKYFQPSADPGD